MPTITISATDGSGQFSAYLAEPARKPAGAVVVIQEIFGVNQAMRESADALADQGFLAVVPDLFWRQKPGIELTDKSKEEWDEAFALMNAMSQDLAIDDLKATLAAARAMPGANGRAGTIGYCLGGRLAFMMAERSDADINVSYYGVGIDGLLGEIGHVSKPLVVHIADNDAFFPAEGRAKVVAAAKDHPMMAVYAYPDADHAFARIGGTHWQARAASIANGRTTEALAVALG